LSRLARFEFDQPYVDRLAGGDPETEQHFTAYFGRLLTLKLRSKLRSPSQVEDAKQETFVRVLTTLKQKRGLATAGSLGAFVSAVCNNVVFELYRSGARATPLADDHDEPDERQPHADFSLIAREERARVQEALADLPQKEKDLLRWLFFEERDKDEVCRELNVDRAYLRVLLHRAKNRFRDRYTTEPTH
jgi:RNA polymerase sigma-70 factor (ECF subfamily)